MNKKITIRLSPDLKFSLKMRAGTKSADLGFPPPMPTEPASYHPFAFKTQIVNPPGYIYDQIYYKRSLDENWTPYILGAEVEVYAKGKLYTIGFGLDGMGDIHSRTGVVEYDLENWTFDEQLIFCPIAPLVLLETLTFEHYAVEEIDLAPDILVYQFGFTPLDIIEDISTNIIPS